MATHCQVRQSEDWRVTGAQLSLATPALSTFRMQEEAAVIPVPFVLRRLTRDVSLLYVIVSTAMGTTYTAAKGAHDRQKKSGKTKKGGLVASLSFAPFVISSGRISFQPLRTIANDIKQPHNGEERVINRLQLLDESLLLPTPAATLHFALFSN
jgi:hypothetical protein